jgi:hypothetical protein
MPTRRRKGEYVRKAERIEREAPSAASAASAADLCWTPMMAITSWETSSGNRMLKLG